VQRVRIATPSANLIAGTLPPWCQKCWLCSVDWRCCAAKKCRSTNDIKLLLMFQIFITARPIIMCVYPVIFRQKCMYGTSVTLISSWIRSRQRNYSDCQQVDVLVSWFVSELSFQRVDCQRVDASASWFVSELSFQRVDCQRDGLSARCLWSDCNHWFSSFNRVKGDMLEIT